MSAKKPLTGVSTIKADLMIKKIPSSFFVFEQGIVGWDFVIYPKIK